MFRRFILPFLALTLPLLPVPAQEAPNPSSLRNYVGRVSQGFSSGFAASLREIGEELIRMGQPEAAASIENYLRGEAGTGFVYVAADGANYIITGHSAISQAAELSIRFEGGSAGGGFYTGLSLVAADEELDIALLAFEGGARPFAGGLPLLERPPRQGETVYAAGYPAAGKDGGWQFGRGQVSIPYIRIPGGTPGPARPGTARMRGPYIRHSAHTERDIPGGLLLALEPGAGRTGGFAVAGISLEAGDPQTERHALPIDRVGDFLRRALGERREEERIALEKRLLAFSRLTADRPRYPALAAYLANGHTRENTAALGLALNGAYGGDLEALLGAIMRSPAEGIRLAAAWALENRFFTEEEAAGKAGGLEAAAIGEAGGGLYEADLLKPGGGLIGSRWVNEYGIWRIRDLVESSAVSAASPEAGDSRDLYLFSFSAGYAYDFNRDHILTVDSSLHLRYAGLGMRIYYGGSSYLRGEGILGLYFPVSLKNNFGITPFAGFGLGFIRREGPGGPEPETFDLCLSGQGGLRIGGQSRGLFLQIMYQYNYEAFIRRNPSTPHLFGVGLGYGF